MVQIIIQGAHGRMGRALSALVAQRDDCCVVAGVDANPQAPSPFPVYPSLQQVAEPANVLIDFSLPEATAAAIPVCVERGLPCVVCTTGLDDETVAQLEKAAQSIPVFRSANMSLGINLMVQLVQKAQNALPGFDIEIIEKHHRNKLDAPSGTALLLADAINRAGGEKYTYVYDRQSRRQARSNNEIGISALRGGSIVGQHEVLFAGPDEVLTICHEAASREVFANGAIAAALFLAGKQPGRYSMQDLMEAL